jgi:hypothetical protein
MPRAKSPGRQPATRRAPPAILSLPSTDLLSIAICAYLGAASVYRRAAQQPQPQPQQYLHHLEAAIAAALTAFGGGHTYYTLAAWRDHRRPWDLQHWAWGRLAWQQRDCVAAALVGFAIALPLGHPVDCLHVGVTAPALELAADCLNWGILAGWAVSKLAREVGPTPISWRQGLGCVPFAWAYTAAGGSTRDLIFRPDVRAMEALPCVRSASYRQLAAAATAAARLLLRLLRRWKESGAGGAACSCCGRPWCVAEATSHRRSSCHCCAPSASTRSCWLPPSAVARSTVSCSIWSGCH